MTGSAGQRLGKKRALASLLNAMFRTDAIYPDVTGSTHAFSLLIIMSKLLLDDGRINPADTRMLAKLLSPHIKLRRDDCEFVCNQIVERGMKGNHIMWLVSYMKSAMTPDRSLRLREDFDQLAFNSDRLRPAEVTVLREARRLLGYDQALDLPVAATPARP